jgi:hypothetical protein
VLLSSKQQRLKDSVCITMMSSVWVQLYYKGEAKPVGEVDPIEISYDSIENVNENVNDLKKKVKEDRVNKLKHADAADLKVYSSGTTVPVKDPPTGPAALAANVIVSEAARGATYDQPLIVIAPKPEQQNGELRCCSRIILVFKVASNVSPNTEIWVELRSSSL